MLQLKTFAKGLIVSATANAGDSDRAQAYLLTTGAGAVSCHVPRVVLKHVS